MMLLSEIFEQLTYGEYAQLFVGNLEEGQIAVAKYPEVVAHLNLALTAMHRRFPLRHEEVILNLNDAITNYYLRTQYAVSNTVSTEPVKYIADSAGDPFQDNILKIESVFDAEGNELPLNNDKEDNSVFTPKFDQLLVPFAATGIPLSVIYRANHPRIEVTQFFNPATEEIELPDYLIEPILMHIAARIAPNNSGQEGVGLSAFYMQRYNTAILEIEDSGMVNIENPTDTRLEIKGWV